MSKSARSIFVFGIYLGVFGLSMLIIPNTVLGMVSIPSTNEVWIRIVGMLLFLLGYYYIQAARKETTDFFQWTVPVRSSIILFLTTFVILGLVKPIIILLGVIDLAGAIWTGMTLRTSK
ncbi:MAG: hypothetical protein HY867_03505 [Chloroflexi bacterium]|nr:hypothetical protein [Chloroflexota bacterium]